MCFYGLNDERKFIFVQTNPLILTSDWFSYSYVHRDIVETG